VDAFSDWAIASNNPTAVDLLTFTATPAPEGVLVEWETGLELDTLGFNLYRASSLGGAEVRPNDTLIPASEMGSVFGAHYEWLDVTAALDTVYFYWLEDVDVYGITTRHGPVSTKLIAGALYSTYLPLVLR